MVDLETVENEIITLEKRDTSYATVERLAWLYIVRDNLKQYKAPERVKSICAGEFCEACEGVPINALMDVLAEHFEAIKILHPREYDHVLSKIKELRS